MKFLKTFSLLVLINQFTFAFGLSPVNLKCEYKINPLGIDVASPRFFWIIPNAIRGAKQTAYQILVASDQNLLLKNNGDVWDSKKVESDENIQIPYSGKKLASHKRYYWKVKYWDENGKASEYSVPAWFETSFLNSEEWKADWISDGKPMPQKDEDLYKEDPAPLFRKKFNSSGKLKEARLYITGLGYYEAYLNGEKVGNEVLSPGWTTYSKKIQYSAYDITDLIKKGDNAIGVMLGNGWYNPLPMKMWGWLNIKEFLTTGRPRFIAELHLTYENGKQSIVKTDASWKVSDGPILKNNIYLGELYDARKEAEGWNKPGFDDSNWRKASITSSPGGKLVSSNQPAIEITRTVKPIKITEPSPGVYLFDMGQNFAGWINMKVKGAEGNKITFRYGELISKEGNLNAYTSVAGQIKEKLNATVDTVSIKTAWAVDGQMKEIVNTDGGTGCPKTAWQEDYYILNKSERQYFQSHFAFHGFRYVEVKGLSYKPSLDDMVGLRLNSAVTKNGAFESSNEMFNKIQNMIEWTFLSNIFSVESDCPAREKFGYGGDMVAAGEAFLLNFDMAGFYTKAVQDFADAARPQGGMTETAPFNGIADRGVGDSTGPIGWQLAYPFVQKKLYEFYGDKRIIEAQYPVTLKFAEFLKSKAENNLIQICIGDHESLALKDVELTGAVFYYHIVKLVSDFAMILDRQDDYKKYSELSNDIKSAILDKFLRPWGRLSYVTQASQIMGLWYDLIPKNQVDSALSILVKDIMEKNKGHLNTGIFGTKMMFNVLQKFNKPEVAYTVANQKTFPGWGFMLENGATTLWEHWEHEDSIYSHNHPMFGSVSEFFYKSLAGINQQEGSAGFNKIAIKPQLNKDLQWVKGSYESIRGTIASNWYWKDGSFCLKVTVPGNAQAKVYVPFADNSKNIREGNDKLIEQGKLLNSTPFIQFVESKDGYAVFNVQAGEYLFEVF